MGVVSENGPREGTKDLPRRDRDAGFRSVDPGTPAGATYRSLARRELRRSAELAALIARGLADDAVAASYAETHPLERPVAAMEIRRIRRSAPKISHRSVPG